MADHPTPVAAFVSAHGFGHAARASAVLDALGRLLPGLRVELFTTVPTWFFAESLAMPFDVHPVQTDVGLVQLGPLEEDLEATADRLDAFLPFDREEVRGLAGQLRRLGCRAVLCDISPFGLEVAKEAGLPSVLVENFTWDWIYRGYDGPPRRLLEHADDLARHFASAVLHLQAEPACAPLASATAVAPVSRRPRHSRRATRDRLGVPRGRPMVLLTMGGTAMDYGRLDRLRDRSDVTFVVAGDGSPCRRGDNFVSLARNSSHFHPDLVHAADLVVGKLGYSTVAETYHAGCRLAFVSRPRFPESPVVARFVTREMASTEVEPAALKSFAWLDQLDHLLDLSPPAQPATNGADQAARRIADLLAG
jgi:hypothetical protein